MAEYGILIEYEEVPLKVLFIENKEIQDALQKVKHLSEEYRKEQGKNPTYHLHTFGCQMNDHDSERIAGVLESMGYEETPDEKDASVILLNTCAIRENAEQKVFGFLGRLKHLKAKGTLIGVCGCMAQQEHIRKKIRQSFPQVDMVFGTHNYAKLPLYLIKALEGEKSVEILEDSEEILEGMPAIRSNMISTFVNIMEGCNNFCTYCIVPYTRGREKSRAAEDIVEEIRSLVAQGTKEVTLLGQNVNSYGKGLEPKIDFPDLLQMVADIVGLERIRFMTSHPKDLSEKLIEMMKHEKICPSFHLPVQSGSTAMLKAMNRKYTREEYLAKVKALREAVPGIALTTDIIIGFPGETMEDVEDTISLIKEVEYDAAFTFIYSPRVGTPAAKIKDDLPVEEKHRRFEAMLDVLNEIVIRKNAARLGQVFEVLVEEELEAGILQGRSPENFLIRFPATKDDLGELRQVKITHCKKFSLEGELCH